MKYVAFLTNDEGCEFDVEVFNNLKLIKKWASGRGHNYICEVYEFYEHPEFGRQRFEFPSYVYEF